MSEIPQTAVAEEPSSLLTTGKPAVILTGIFRHLLIRTFSSRENIKTEALKDYVWSPDKKETKIVIEPNFKVDWQLVEHRPAVIIRRDRMEPHKLGIGDYVSGPVSAGDGDHFVRAFAGSHTLFCVSGKGLIAELLGQEVCESLMEFAPLIREDLGFSRFEGAHIGEVMQVEESDTHWVVPVTFAYAYTHSWKLTPEAPWFKVFAPSAHGV